MTSRQKIIFHIGAHKTASSFLYRNLRASLDSLSHGGLDVVLRRDILNTVFARELHEVAQGARAGGDVSSGARANIRRIIARHNPDNNLLIANEDMVCRLNVQDFYQNIDASMRHIRRALDGHDVRIMLHIRCQADYLESVYMQYVHLGRSLRFDRFMERAGTVDFSWLRVVEGIAREVPPGRITVRPFESIRTLGSDGFFQEFLRLCEVSDPESFSTSEDSSKGSAANRSYSGLGMKIARRANPLLDKKEKRILRKFLQENFSTATHPRAELLDPGQRQEIFERYADSNRKLFAEYDLGASGGDLGYY